MKLFAIADESPIVRLAVFPENGPAIILTPLGFGLGSGSGSIVRTNLDALLRSDEFTEKDVWDNVPLEFTVNLPVLTGLLFTIIQPSY